MADPPTPAEQKRRVMANFNAIAANYDSLGFVQRCAQRLLELANLKTGENVLDVATGTGLVATIAAQSVGANGKVVGVDFSPEMLSKAKQKATGIPGLEFQEGDAEHLNFPDESFNVVMCASSLFFIPDMLQAVREGWRVLEPGGRLGFSSFGSSFFQPLQTLWREQLEKHGILLPFPPTHRLAEPTTCEALLREAGFTDINVQKQQLGYYQTLDERWQEIKASLEGVPLSKLSEEQQAQIKSEHVAELGPLLTGQGLWVDVAANFAFGWKPDTV